MFDNNLISGAKQMPAEIFKLELLIDSESKQVTYNQFLLPGKTTQSNTGITMVYYPIKECNVQIACNNKDLIERKVIKDGAYIKYSINCSKSRIAEFKEDLVKFARVKEAELLASYQKAVETKTELLVQLDTYLGSPSDDESGDNASTGEEIEGI